MADYDNQFNPSGDGSAYYEYGTHTTGGPVDNATSYLWLLERDVNG